VTCRTSRKRELRIIWALAHRQEPSITYAPNGMEKFLHEEHELAPYFMQRVKDINGMRIFGEGEHQSRVNRFLVGDLHESDMGTKVDRRGISYEVSGET